MHRIKYFSLPLLSFLLPVISKSQNFGGNPSSIDWKQVNTEKSRVIFPAGMDSQANRISNVVSLLDTATLYSIGNKIRKWNIVLLNQTTLPNAYVRLAPVISELSMTPGQDNFSTGSLRWDDNLIIHEDRHMQQFSNFNVGLTKLFSFFLGQEGQLLANGISVPDYFFEGDAVWQETLVSRQGRGKMPSFFNGLKSLSIAGKNYSWMKLRSGSLRDYTPDHYELGYQLVACYGYEKYGADFWRKVTNDAVRFKGLFFAFNKAIERYSGKTYSQFRNDALLYFKEQTLSASKLSTRTPDFVTPVIKNNVTDYLYPQFVSDDTLIVTKQSYKEINSFYYLVKGKEIKIRMKDYVIDDYFSYRNGKVVYAAYESDPRWSNRDYSVIRLLDLHSNQQTKLTSKSKYFSPDINNDGTEIIAVNVKTDGSNFLDRINAASGELITELPNPENYFFTQTKYINNDFAVSAVRHTDGRMALVKVSLLNGNSELLTEFSYDVLGYPLVKGDTIYYSRMDVENGNPSDKIFAVDLKTKINYCVSGNVNGVYHPAVNSRGDSMVVASFTADGSRLEKIDKGSLLWQLQKSNNAEELKQIGINAAQYQRGSLALYTLHDSTQPAEAYRKSFQLFNFHSARPFSNDPEYGYTFYSDNILSSFSNTLTYTYNRNEQSHAVGFNAVYAGAFPYLSFGVEKSFHREVDTGMGKSVSYNATKLSAGFNLPLNFIGGRTFRYLNFGASINSESIPYQIVNKSLETKMLNYVSSFFRFTNTGRQTMQSINPEWAQTFTVTYRDALNIIDNHKIVADGSLYFPGLFKNHSLVFDAAYQKKDTLADFFSKTFPFSRGYQDLNQRRMYKVGVNYHFPLFYPDWGFGNIVFFQRIRANAFYDYTSSLTKFRNGTVTEIKNRSTGGEVYFDTKIWNELPVSIGVRYSRLLDYDYLNPGAVNRWEIILPINLIPN